MDKVINPKSGKAITIGGKLYNSLIEEGYIFKNGELLKTKNRRVIKEDVPYNIVESKRPQYYKYDPTVPYYPLPNVRCIECNKPINLYNRYSQLLQEGYEPIEVFEELNIKRLCCRKEYSHPHLEPFPYINEELIADEPAKKVSKNPKLIKKGETKVIRLYENDKLLGLKQRIDTEEGTTYVESRANLKNTPIASGKYYISSVK